MTDALDRLAVQWTKTKHVTVSVAREADVATLDRFIERES